MTGEQIVLNLKTYNELLTSILDIHMINNDI